MAPARSKVIVRGTHTRITSSPLHLVGLWRRKLDTWKPEAREDSNDGKRLQWICP